MTQGIEARLGPMRLAVAERYADRIMAWLEPVCNRLAVAGSVRRRRPVCRDIDLVCIPKTMEERDLFGEVTGRRNVCQESVLGWAREHGRACMVSGGEAGAKYLTVELAKCRLDVWFADERTWGTRLLCRTGSREHNIWLCRVAERRGLHWDPYEGLVGGGRALGLDWIEPQRRESEWLLQLTVD